MSVTHHTEAFVERHPALTNLLLAAGAFVVGAALYWLIGHVGGLPR